MTHYVERRRHYLLLTLASTLAALAFMALKFAAFLEEVCFGVALGARMLAQGS